MHFEWTAHLLAAMRYRPTTPPTARARSTARPRATGTGGSTSARGRGTAARAARAPRASAGARAATASTRGKRSAAATRTGDRVRGGLVRGSALDPRWVLPLALSWARPVACWWCTLRAPACPLTVLWCARWCATAGDALRGGEGGAASRVLRGGLYDSRP